MLSRAGGKSAEQGGRPHRPSRPCEGWQDADQLGARLPAGGEALRLRGLRGASIPSTQGGGGFRSAGREAGLKGVLPVPGLGGHPDPSSHIELLCLALRTLRSLAPLAPATAVPTPLIITLRPGRIHPLHRPSQSSFPFLLSHLAPTVLLHQRDLHLWAPPHNPPPPSPPPAANFQPVLGLAVDGMLPGSHLTSAQSDSKFAGA